MKITVQDRHLCWSPYFFLGPAMVPPLFLILESPLVRECGKAGACW